MQMPDMLDMHTPALPLRGPTDLSTSPKRNFLFSSSLPPVSPLGLTTRLLGIQGNESSFSAPPTTSTCPAVPSPNALNMRPRSVPLHSTQH